MLIFDPTNTVITTGDTIKAIYSPVGSNATQGGAQIITAVVTISAGVLNIGTPVIVTYPTFTQAQIALGVANLIATTDPYYTQALIKFGALATLNTAVG